MANVTWTVPNKNGSYDGDMVVKQFTSMTINSGDTVTVDQPCRGLFILVQGDCTINGTLHMNSRGPYANPTTSGANDSNAVDSNGLRFPFVTSGSDTLTAAATLLNGCGTDARDVISNFASISGNGVIKSLVRQGASGGGAINSSGTGQQRNGVFGSNGSTGQTGGGGGGSYGYAGTGYAGNYGSCWGGGSGGGSQNNPAPGATSGTAWGGAGGNSTSGHNATVTDGAGNPSGGITYYGNAQSDYTASPQNYSDTTGNGTGGLIILIVGGNLTVGASGKILATGGDAVGILHQDNQEWASTGGGAGGGNILIAHRGTYTNSGTVSANGGRGGGYWYPNSSTLRESPNSGANSTTNNSSVGGNGGNGSVQVVSIS
jgi:hypothetical protein